MTIDEYIDALELIQNRLIGMPEAEALGESFAAEQEKLAGLIAHLNIFSPDDQAKAKAIMRVFSDKLTQKLNELKARMGHLSQDMEQQQNKMKGMKAYGQSGQSLF